MNGQDPELAGLALAGGRSRRFGREKAAALLGGRPLLAWTVEALMATCGTVAVSARAGSEAEALAAEAGLTVLHDMPGFPEGPLAGVAAGLAWAQEKGFQRLAVLPCDTPLVGPAAIVRLAAALGPDDAVAVAQTPGYLHALCAVLRADRVGPFLQDALARGEHPAIRRAWAGLGLAVIDFGDDPAFANVNTPADLEELGRRRTPL